MKWLMVKDMAASAAEMLEAAGAKNVQNQVHPSAPGWAIHEVGIARMGNDPKKSVLNAVPAIARREEFVCNGRSWVHFHCLPEPHA